ISNEPVLISQLIQYSCITIAERALERSLAIAPPEADAAAELYHKLAAYDVYGPFTHAVRGERCFGLWAFDLVQRDPRGAALIIGAGGSEDGHEDAGAGAVASALTTLAGP